MFCNNVSFRTACSKHGVSCYASREDGPYFPRTQCTLHSSATFLVFVRFKTSLKEQIVWLENIWEQPNQIKILFRKKLRAH